MSQGLLPLWDTEEKFLRFLYDVEHNGIKVNKELCKDLSVQAESAMQTIEDSLGFRPSEPTKLGPFLLEELKLPILKVSETTSKPSFDRSVMEEYDLLLENKNDVRARLVLEYRGWQKAYSSCYKSYLDLVSPDERIRSSFKMHGTRTGRLSCEKPNLQQIPRSSNKPWNGQVKQCFIPESDEWELWEFDYSTLEFRIAAVYANNPALIERINNGEDLHQASVDMIRDKSGIEFDRYTIKTTNFLKLYGGQVKRLALQLRLPVEKAMVINTAWDNTFPEMRLVMADAEMKAKLNGHVKYWTGRRKHYGTYWNKGAEHKAFNALCQGGGAEVTKTAAVKTHHFASVFARPVLTVHDSIVWEIKKDHVGDLVPKIKSEMESGFPFSVELVVDAHKWGEG